MPVLRPTAVVRKLAGVAALIAVLAMAGCGRSVDVSADSTDVRAESADADEDSGDADEDSVDVREVEPDHAPDLTLLAIGQHADYEPAMSPEELIDMRDPQVIVTGAVESIDQGRDIYDIGEEEPQQNLVMAVRVSDELRSGGPGDVHDGRVHVELSQGARYNDGSGPVHSLEDWRVGVPEGTRMMLFLYDSDRPEEQDLETEHDGRGLPDGAELLVPDIQGPVVEYDDELLGVDYGGDFDVSGLWDVDSIADISERVSAHLS